MFERIQQGAGGRTLPLKATSLRCHAGGSRTGIEPEGKIGQDLFCSIWQRGRYHSIMMYRLEGSCGFASIAQVNISSKYSEGS